MLSQDPLNHERVVDDVQNAFTNITGRKPQSSSQPEDVFNIDIPSTRLPTLASGSDLKSSQTGLAKCLSYESIHTSSSRTERQNALITTWAKLLHLYVVSDAVAFVVIGKNSTRNEKQLVVSRWPSPSGSLRRNNGLELQFGEFNPSKHGEAINTVVSFADIYNADSNFSYALHCSDIGAADLCLYTKQPVVPHKFASALWSTLLKVNADLRSTEPLKISNPFISREDQIAIQSFLPGPLFAAHQCLHHLFLESVRAAPQAPAVQAWDGSFTYTTLDTLSNNVAHQLVHAGVRVGQYVLFSFEKTAWMVVAVLGILKAGGALVPIDPSQPQSRAEDIIKETHASIVVVSTSQASRFATFVDTVLPVSSNTVDRFEHGTGVDTELPRVQPGNPAMIIFTSGSTGKPKGIVIQHGAAATRFLAEGRAFQYQGARTLQFAASTWDIFMTDIFTTLSFQGCVCVPNEEDRRFNLSGFCEANNVSLALITPSLANLLEPAKFPTLRTLIFGGEALREDVVQKWSAVEGISLHQGYGPAECGPCIAGALADRPEALGYALDNSICMLINPNNPDQLVPLGATGELVVGGPSLLREYLNSPNKTDSSLIENPSWSFDIDTPVKRFYKTGDLLRYSIDTLDGRLEFVGRTDDQIKFHGQRIELGEIEHHLNNLPEIVSCMVTLVKSGHFKDRLVAVVQPEGLTRSRGSSEKLSIRHDAGVTISRVRDFLSSRLPEYMIPNELLVVEELPYSSSMKLHRSLVNKWICGLQNGVSSSPAESQSYTQIESKLLAHESTARAVAKEYAYIVAGNNELGRNEFQERDFNLQSKGIDSVQIMSLSMALTRRYGVQIPMSEMLSSKATVRTIAAAIDAGRVDSSKIKQNKPLDLQDEVTLRLRAITSTSGGSCLESQVNGVFLTGSSGFLGIEILRQLLTQTDAHVYALIRGASEGEARERLIRRANESGWWQDTYKPRLHIWLGDIAKPQLGLSKTQWQAIQGQVSPDINSIIHNGAKVHYNLDYDSLRATNVSPTVELLKAVTSREQPLHSFVFVSGGQNLSFNDKEENDPNKATNGTGYARSKVVSELLVKRFAEQQDWSSKARYVRVVKPGFIIGDAERGVANRSDFVWRLIAASIEIGAYNRDDEDDWLFISDVTRVSQTIMQSAIQEDTKPTMKILDGMRFKDLWGLLQDKFGYGLQPLPRQEWLSHLRQAVTVKQEKHVMFPLMYMLEASDGPIGARGGPLHATAGVETAVEANITHLINVGFLPRPALTATPATSDDCAPTETDAIDVQSVRENFPGLHHGLVAFNNAAGTVLHRGSVEGTNKYMLSLPIELGRDDPRSHERTEGLGNTYGELAAFMNAEPDEIAFGQSTTFLLRSLGQALRSSLSPDCEVIVSSLCHEASAASWIKLASDLNIAIKWWTPGPGDHPCLTPETLKPLLTPKTRIVACNHVSNVVGTIHPIRQIADVVHSIPGAVLIVDGVAWAPHRPIDVKALDVDFYCFSWYKVFGPHVAQLYGRRRVQQKLLSHMSHYFLSSMPGLDWRLRLGANSFELEAGLVPIARYLKNEVGWENIIAQETVLQDTFLSYLRRHPRTFRIFGEQSSDPQRRVSVITFQVIGQSCLEVTNRICQRGRFRVVSGNCWAPRPTHDVLGLDDDGLIRVSFVHYNTVAEVVEFCKELEGVLGDLGGWGSLTFK